MIGLITLMLVVLGLGGLAMKWAAAIVTKEDVTWARGVGAVAAGAAVQTAVNAALYPPMHGHVNAILALAILLAVGLAVNTLIVGRILYAQGKAKVILAAVAEVIFIVGVLFGMLLQGK